MTKFDVLKSIEDVNKFSELIIDVLKDKRTSEELAAVLAEEISEDGLQIIESIARSDYPLSLERKQ